MERAGLYIRVSSGLQRDNYSPETQIEQGMAYIGANGYAVAPEHVFREVYSAKNSGDSRPELLRLKEAVIRGEITVIVALKVDRIFRDIDDAILFRRFLKQHEARIEFVLERFEDTAIGKFMYQLAAYSAESRWEDIREATIRGRQARVKSGKPLAAGKPMYGYRWFDPERKAKTRLIPFEPEAAVIRMIFRVLAEGGSLSNLETRLLAEGIPGPAGGQWGTTTVSRIVRNEGYAGRAFANRWQTLRTATGKKSQKLRPREEWTPLPDGTIPALVDSETWAKANARIEQNRQVEGSRNLRNPEDFLLRNGYARCGVCGEPMSAKNPSAHRPSYRCPQHIIPGTAKRCSGTSFIAADLDDAVWSRVRTVLTDPDWCKAYVAEQADTAVMDADLAAVEAELKDIAKRQSRLIGNLELVDDESAAEIRGRLADLKEQKTRLQAEYHSISTRRANLKQAEDFIDRLIARAATVDAMTYAERRSMLSEFGVRATVYPASHPFRYTVDFAFEIEGLPVAGDGDSGEGSGVTVLYSDYYGENEPDLSGEPKPGQADFGLQATTSRKASNG